MELFIDTANINEIAIASDWGFVKGVTTNPALIAKEGLTQKDVADILGIAQPTVNQKINNVRPMDLREAEKLAELLDIKPEEFQIYFFG